MPIFSWHPCWRVCRFFFVACVAGSSALAAHAQAPGSVRLDPTPTLRASQADTPVPPVTYRSVLADLPQGVEDTVLDWKAANAAVGQFPRGHADLLKWEQAQARKPAPTTQEAQP